MSLYKRLKSVVEIALRYRKAEITGCEFVPGVRDEFDVTLQENVNFIESAKRTQKHGESVPEGYKENAQGGYTPINRIKPIDLLRDELVTNIISEVVVLNEQLRALKENALDEIATFLELSASEHGVKLGGRKGNVLLMSFDGRYKVQRTKHDFMTFDEQLLVAKELITQCLEDWSGRPGVPRGLIVIAERAFRRNSAGDISVSRVMDLRSHDIDDDRWKKAMAIITDSITVQSTVTYLRLYERVGNSEDYKLISLDIAAV